MPCSCFITCMMIEGVGARSLLWIASSTNFCRSPFSQRSEWDDFCCFRQVIPENILGYVSPRRNRRVTGRIERVKQLAGRKLLRWKFLDTCTQYIGRTGISPDILGCVHSAFVERSPHRYSGLDILQWDRDCFSDLNSLTVNWTWRMFNLFSFKIPIWNIALFGK